MSKGNGKKDNKGERKAVNEGRNSKNSNRRAYQPTVDRTTRPPKKNGNGKK